MSSVPLSSVRHPVTGGKVTEQQVLQIPCEGCQSGIYFANIILLFCSMLRSAIGKVDKSEHNNETFAGFLIQM